MSALAVPGRSVPARRALRLAGCLGVVAALAGLGACATAPAGGTAAAATRSAGLNPSWPAVPAGAALLGADGQPLAVVIAPVADARPGQPGRRLGRAEAAVFGQHGPELMLAREASAVVGEVLHAQLRAAGLVPVTAAQPAGLRLEVTLQALSLQVAARDQRHVAVQASLRRQADGVALWSGVLENRDDRFAGVSGNDRADLEAYLGAGMADVAARLALALRQKLAVPVASAPPAAMAVPSPSPSPSPSASAAAAATLPAAAPARGFIAVTSLPSRARVYVDDVYHGLTPMTLELPAGVSQLHLKLDGWRTASEKVAVRSGATVELELKLQR